MFILVFTLPLSQVSIPRAEGHGQISLSGFGTPTIDGILTPGEWDSAAQIRVFGGDFTGSLFYVMNDETNLYLALSVVDPAPSKWPGDSFSVSFDNSHNGVDDQNDPIFGIRSSRFTERPSTSHPHMRSEGSNDGTRHFWEVSHPLDRGNINDLSLKIGDTVGFCLGYSELTRRSSVQTIFPPNCTLYFLEQSRYGDIVIASGGTIPDPVPVPAVQKPNLGSATLPGSLNSSIVGSNLNQSGTIPAIAVPGTLFTPLNLMIGAIIATAGAFTTYELLQVRKKDKP